MRSEKKTSNFLTAKMIMNKFFSFVKIVVQLVFFLSVKNVDKQEKNKLFSGRKKLYILRIYKSFFLPTSGVRKRGFKDCPFFPTLLTDKAKFSQEVNGKKWKQNFLWR